MNLSTTAQHIGTATSGHLRLRLLEHFLTLYPLQPSVVFWRVIEMETLLSIGFPQGEGLDLGCGDGKFSRVLCSEAGLKRWAGVDRDKLSANSARNSKIYKTVYCGCSSQLPIGSETLDFIFSNSVLEHVEPIEATLSEISRVLKRGGKLLFSVPSPHFLDYLSGSLLPWKSRNKYTLELRKLTSLENCWSLTQWGEALKQHGLMVNECIPYFNREQTRCWESLSRWTSGILYVMFGRRKNANQMLSTLRLKKQAFMLPRPVSFLIESYLIRLLNRSSLPSPENRGGYFIWATKADGKS